MLVQLNLTLSACTDFIQKIIGIAIYIYSLGLVSPIWRVPSGTRSIAIYHAQHAFSYYMANSLHNKADNYICMDVQPIGDYISLF